jgi:cellulose synthase operon protein YhjQ
LAELRAQSEAEAAAKQADSAASAAHAEADAATAKLAAKQAAQAQAASRSGHAWAEPNGRGSSSGSGSGSGSREAHEQVKHASLRAAAKQARKAAAEREVAARRAEAAALAESIARREHEEIEAARASGMRQAARYEEAGVRGKTRNGFTFEGIPGKTGDPYSSRWLEEEEDFHAESPKRPFVQESEGDLQDTQWGHRSEESPRRKDAAVAAHAAGAGRTKPVTSPAEVLPEKVLSRAADDSRAEVVKRIPAGVEAPSWKEEAPARSTAGAISPFEVTAYAMSELFEAEPIGTPRNSPGTGHPAQGSHGVRGRQAATAVQPGADKEPNTRRTDTGRSAASGWVVDVPGPAWLYPRQPASSQHRAQAGVPKSAEASESLEHSTERIAARWFALRGVFARHDADRSSERPVGKAETRQAPIVAVFSLAGGAGKTSLVATLGRTLSFLGERVLLSDTTSHGLLPFYFGASQLVSGVVRTFSPPAGSTDAPIHLVSYEMVRETEEGEGQAGIVEDLLENSQRANRVLLDLDSNSSRMVGLLGQFQPTILIPLMADLNSVISIDAVEKLFNAIRDADGRPLQPVYLLNQFDAALPLHLDIREVLKQQLGERLLPFVVRRSPAVGEALAEGMTVVDYDPGSAIAEDYLRVANWLRSVSAPMAVGFRNQRWSEQ